MPKKLDTVLFAQHNYFRTSLITIFEQIETINLVGTFPFKNVFDFEPIILKSDLIVCVLQETKPSFHLDNLLQVLATDPNRKILIIGSQPNCEYDAKKIVFHPNIACLSKQVVKTYLDHLFIR